MHFHAQNLYEVGSMFWEGRCWLRVNRRLRFALEWAHGKRAHWAAATVQLGNGDSQSEVTFHIGLPRLFSWFFTVGHPRLERRDEREIGVRLYEGYLTLALWKDPNGWSSTQPRWWEMSVNIPDLLLGKAKYSQRTLETGSSIFPMPEQVYPVKWELFESTWKRPRWRIQRLVRCELEFPVPIPIPGKGENSWDCGDDAIWSQTSPESDPEKAIGALQRDVLKRRAQYGGTDWRPEPQHEGEKGCEPAATADNVSTRKGAGA